MASTAISSSAFTDPKTRTDVVPRRRLWPLSSNVVGPGGAIGEIARRLFGEDAVKVLLRRGLQILGSQIGNGTMPNITPSKGPLEEKGEGKNKLHGVGNDPLVCKCG